MAATREMARSSINRSEKVLRDLLQLADVEVNGGRPWDIQVNNPAFYDSVLRDGSLGAGEAYMQGWWDCDALDQFFHRVLLTDLPATIQRSPRIQLQILRARLVNMQSRSKAFEVGERHYDLGNDLYQAMLDKRLVYTCAYWENASTLDEAQEAKLDLVCKKIGLKPGMSVLELGCGWGSFAKYAAEKYGASVLGVTVSKEQVALGTELCKGLPVELRLQDYREVEGKFDAVISIGLMEHVGPKNYRTYMEVADRCLKQDGVAFIHTIGNNFRQVSGDAWLDKYIFPNGTTPSVSQLSTAWEGIFELEDWHSMGPHYDRTLMAWSANFEKAWPQLISKYDERFHRMWHYYLMCCAGSFRARMMQLWQIVLTRVGTPQPGCRIS